MVNICPINEEEFNKAKPLHEKALKSSGFNKNLIFESTQKKPSWNRKRMVWFNPPYNTEVNTNIGSLFKTSPKTFSQVPPLQENIKY